MTQERSLLPSAEELAVMKFAARGIGIPIDNISEDCVDWQKFLSVAIQHNLVALVADGIGMNPPEDMPLEERMQIAAASIQVERTMAKQLSVASELAEMLSECQERMVALKGLSFGSYYPNMLHRYGSDLDCFFLDDFKRCIDLLRKNNIKVNDNYYRHFNAEYKGLKLECHQFCTPIRGNRKMKCFERILQSLLFESHEKIANSNLLRPCAMFNALFFMSHAASHFKVESLNLRYLTDWAVILQQDVEWEEFRRICAEFDLLKFADAMTKLVIEYMSVSLPESYDLSNDDEGRSALLLDFILHENRYVFNHRSKLPFGSYLNVGLGIFKGKKKTSYFFKESIFSLLISKVYGLTFDRKPKL